MLDTKLQDSWIFLSIVCSSGGTLADFYWAADYINVSIPSDREVEESVNRLIACGLVSVKDNSLSVTDKGQEMYQSIKKLSAYPRLQVGLAAPLISQCISPGIIETQWNLDPVVAENALQAYVQGFKKRAKNRGQ